MLEVRTVQDGRHPTKIRLRHSSRPISTFVTNVPDPEPAYIQKPGADPISVPSALKVQLRDSARYCFVDSPSEVAFPNLNLLHKNTVAARGLLGAAIGQKRHVAMPMGKRRIRVLDVLKAQPRFSSAPLQLPALLNPQMAHSSMRR